MSYRYRPFIPDDYVRCLLRELILVVLLSFQGISAFAAELKQTEADCRAANDSIISGTQLASQLTAKADKITPLIAQLRAQGVSECQIKARIMPLISNSN